MGLLWAMSIPGLFVLLFVLAAVELSAGRLKWLPWRRGREKKMATGLATEELFAFFYATKRAELEQRQTELVMPQREDDGAPPGSRIDLDSGTALIKPPTRD